MYFRVVLCIVCFVTFPVLFVCEQLPPGGYPIAVKYIMYIARLAKRLGSQPVSYFFHCYMAQRMWKTGISPRLEGFALTAQTC